MIKLLTLLGMLYLHIVDDYYLQGNSFLVSGKQKKWWKDNEPDHLYRKDYIIVLVEHAFSWTIAIMAIPALYMVIFEDHYYSPMNIIAFSILFIFNWFLHSCIDHAKANEKSINLITDQIIHVIQVICTWLLLIAFA